MCGGRGGGTRNTSTPLTSGKCLSGPSMTPPLHNVPKSSQVSWLPMPVPVQLGSPLYSAPSLLHLPGAHQPKPAGAQGLPKPSSPRVMPPSKHGGSGGGGCGPSKGPQVWRLGYAPFLPSSL